MKILPLFLSLAAPLFAGPVPPDREVVFPHGLTSEIQCVSPDRLLVKNGWTRGYGLMEFDLSKYPEVRMISGSPVPGYVKNHVVKGDVMYLASMFGFMVFERKNDAWLLKRNLLVDFSLRTQPGCSVHVFGDHLLLSGRTANRIYDISVPGDPVLTEFDVYPGVNKFASDGETLYAAKDKTLFRRSASGALEAVREFDSPVRELFCRSGEYRVLTAKNVFCSPASETKDVRRVVRTSEGFDVVTKENAKDFPKDSKYDRTGKLLCSLEKGKIRVGDTVIPVLTSDGDLLVTDRAVYLTSGRTLYALDPATLEMVSSLDLPALPKGVKTPGAYNLYFGNSIMQLSENVLVTGGFRIDISNPQKPVAGEPFAEPFLGSWTDGTACAFAVSKRVLFRDGGATAEYVPEGKAPVMDVRVCKDKIFVLTGDAMETLERTDGGFRLLRRVKTEQTMRIAAAPDALWIAEGASSARGGILKFPVDGGAPEVFEGLLPRGVSTLLYDAGRLYAGCGLEVLCFDVTKGKVEECARFTVLSPGKPAPQYTEFTALAVHGGRLYARNYSGIFIWNLQGDKK